MLDILNICFYLYMTLCSCTSCDTQIREYDKYHSSNGAVNQFLCKVCGKCTYCHLNAHLDHILEWDKDKFAVPIISTNNSNYKSDIFDKDWR